MLELTKRGILQFFSTTAGGYLLSYGTIHWFLMKDWKGGLMFMILGLMLGGIALMTANEKAVGD
jgi:hypothetical protein